MVFVDWEFPFEGAKDTNIKIKSKKSCYMLKLVGLVTWGVFLEAPRLMGPISTYHCKRTADILSF